LPRKFLALLAMIVLPSGAVAQQHGDSTTLVTLRYGLSVRVPHTWRSTNRMLGQALGNRSSAVNTTSLELDEDGTVALFAPPTWAEEASFIIVVLPTGVGQSALSMMSDDDVVQADRTWFRPEAEQAAAHTGRHITAWLGTNKTMIGGRYGLVTRYAFTRADGPPLRKETYKVYLGGKQLVFHVHLPPNAGTLVEAQVRQMLASIRIAPTSLE
jgi:hypothetical protein